MEPAIPPGIDGRFRWIRDESIDLGGCGAISDGGYVVCSGEGKTLLMRLTSGPRPERSTTGSSAWRTSRAKCERSDLLVEFPFRAAPPAHPVSENFEFDQSLPDGSPSS